MRTFEVVARKQSPQANISVLAGRYAALDVGRLKRSKLFID